MTDETPKIDLNKVMESHMTETGVTTVTLGTIICAEFGDRFRQLLKHADADSYAQYREIKYPDGPDSVTPESARKALAFIFERVPQLLLPHYLSRTVFQQQES